MNVVERFQKPEEDVRRLAREKGKNRVLSVL